MSFAHLHPQADKVLELLPEFSLARIAKMPGMPSRDTIMRWRGRDEAWAKAYEVALDTAGDAAADDAWHISERMLAGEVPADVGRAAQQERWRTAAVRRPRIYSERQQVEHSGALTLEQLVAAAAEPAKE